MTKLTRLTSKVFGETATATGVDPEIAQFGSALAGTYNGTTDVATIQSLPAWSNGFVGCVTASNQYPPLPEMTGFGKVLSYQLSYLLQQGVPEWDSATTYYTNNYCTESGVLYVSLADSNTNNRPSTSATYWAKFSDLVNTGIIGQPQFTLDFTSVNPPTNCIWLEGGKVLKSSYANLVSVYGDTYAPSDATDTETYLYLPNFKNRVIWGADISAAAGYISAGLPNISGQIACVATYRTPNGAFYYSGGTGAYDGNGDLGTNTVSMDASRQNSIYGSSSTVQPPSIKARFYTRYQ